MGAKTPEQFSAPEYSRLLLIANRLERNPADAEDLLQDAYLRLLLGETDDIKALMPWMRKVMKNLVSDRLRRDRLHDRFLSSRPNGQHHHQKQDVQPVADARIECARLVEKMAQYLSSQELAALILREVFEWSYRELAQSLGKSEAAARPMVNRALHRLRGLRGVDRQHRQSQQKRDEESMRQAYLVCLHALLERNPAGLSALLNASTIKAGMQPPTDSRKRLSHVSTSAEIHQIDGRFAMSLVLDGVVLCVLPLGVDEDETQTA